MELLLATAADSGAVMYELAERWLQAGEKDKALDWLGRVVALHQGYDPSGDAQWTALFDDARFQKLIAAIHASAPPVHRSASAFTVDEKDLIPDGLGYDPSEHMFYLGSMAKRKIVKIHPDGSVSDFISPGQDGMFRVGSGMRVDTGTRTLWVTADEPDSTGVFHYDLRTGRLIRRYVVPAKGRPHLFNDLVVDRRGDVYVSDSWGDGVYRIAHETDRLETFAPDLKLASANGLALSADEAALYVAHFNGGVTLIDLATKKARLLAHPSNVTLAGIDGLYCVGNSLIAVQSGIGWPRVVRFQLNAAGNQVVNMEVLESRNPLFYGWGATTGVVVRDTFYYIANSQIWRLVNDRIDQPDQLTPIQILKVKFR
jgi:sugar lactone lactonase YvrE